MQEVCPTELACKFRVGEVRVVLDVAGSPRVVYWCS